MERTFTGLPNRTALTPSLMQPSNKLSAATFDWAQAKILCCFNPFDISQPIRSLLSRICTKVARIAQAVRVLPVPGGP